MLFIDRTGLVRFQYYGNDPFMKEPDKNFRGIATGLINSSERRVVPATRFACDAYVTFARTHNWLPAVASSLTELFAPDLISARIAALVEKYPWIDDSGLAYFRSRLPLASRDADYALSWVVENATTAQAQEQCLRALEFKCDVLWAILDATQLAFGPGARREPR